MLHEIGHRYFEVIEREAHWWADRGGTRGLEAPCGDLPLLSTRGKAVGILRSTRGWMDCAPCRSPCSSLVGASETGLMGSKEKGLEGKPIPVFRPW